MRYLAGAGEAGVVLRRPLRPVRVMFSLEEARVRVLPQLGRVADEHEVVELGLLHHLTARAELTAVGNVNLDRSIEPGLVQLTKTIKTFLSRACVYSPVLGFLLLDSFWC